MEAMACGLPCITPNNTTGPQLVGEPETGLLTELLKMKNGQTFGWTGPQISDKWLIDPIDFADNMTKIYKDKKMREKFSKNALKFVEDYDWQTKIVPQWIDLFKYAENFVENLDYAKNKPGI